MVSRIKPIYSTKKAFGLKKIARVGDSGCYF